MLVLNRFENKSEFPVIQVIERAVFWQVNPKQFRPVSRYQRKSRRRKDETVIQTFVMGKQVVRRNFLHLFFLEQLPHLVLPVPTLLSPEAAWFQSRRRRIVSCYKVDVQSPGPVSPQENQIVARLMFPTHSPIQKINHLTRVTSIRLTESHLNVF